MDNSWGLQTMHPSLDDLTVQVIYLISYYKKKTQKDSAFGSYRYKVFS